MQKMIIVSDFDGTITEKDSLYHFFEKYAPPVWKDVEQDWVNGKISSKECLIQEFALVPNLSENLIDEFTGTIKIDPYFKEFNDLRIKKQYDFIIVSDGLDYFINKILKKHNLDDIKVVTNHAEFVDDKFVLSFPNEYSGCKNDSGTCKCKVLADLRKNYDKICYIGDGVSDLCVADKADILYAKKSLLSYCAKNGIKHIEYKSYQDILPILV